MRVYQFRHIRAERQSSRTLRPQIGVRTHPGDSRTPPSADVTSVDVEKREKGRRTTILGIIGVAWGSLIIAKMLVHGVPSAASAYDAGRLTAFVFAFALIGAGVWQLRKS